MKMVINDYSDIKEFMVESEIFVKSEILKGVNGIIENGGDSDGYNIRYVKDMMELLKEYNKSVNDILDIVSEIEREM